MKKMGIIILISILFFLSALVLIILPPGGGKISQTERKYLDFDDGKIGLLIKAKDKNKPVLLVCGGGPGIPQFLLEDLYPNCLADRFIVCYMEYRGTGLSYFSDIQASKMTTDHYISDVLAVTDYLKDQYKQKKIYIMGHSFGTYIALNTVSQYPENYSAYLAMSQVCNQKESEIIAFEYMKNEFKNQGNTKAVANFDRFDIKNSTEDYEKYFSSPLRDNSMHQLGIGTTRNMKSVITGIFFPSLRCKAYKPSERIKIWKGKALSHSFPVTKDAISFNSFESIQSIKIPVYFFAGKYDYTCSYELQKKYFETINAPKKEFFTFENSAHSPIYEESEKAGLILDRILSENL